MPTSSPSVKRARQQALDRRVIEPTRKDPAFDKLRASSTMLVPGCGNLEARIAIVGEAPGEHEDRSGVPWVGPAGALLSQFMEDAGLTRENCWMTNVVKYRPVDADGNNRRPSPQEAYSGRLYLKRELAVIGPELVVLCGRVAYNSVRPGRSVVRDRGSTFATSSGRTYLVTLHPSACLQGPDEWTVLSRGDWRMVPRLLAQGALAATLSPAHG
jgi:DNA polymerase